MSFKLWSEINKDAATELKPNFGLVSWNIISKEDRYKVWKYLQRDHFFDPKRKYNFEHKFADENGTYYQFFGNIYEQEFKRKMIGYAIIELNNKYKSKSYANLFLENQTYTEACADFYRILTEESENVVLELLSIYAQFLIEEIEESLEQNQDKSIKGYNQRKEKEKWRLFDKFGADVNEIFSHFNLNVYLTKLGFTFKQEGKLIKEVFEPVINILSHPQWREVNKSLSNAFSEYHKKSPLSYSNCVTNAVTSVQAFLQILCNGKTGTGDISKLIGEAQTKGLIPNDSFTKTIFKNIQSILMQERQDKGIAHPPKDYATEKNARLVINLVMVFFQHCII